MPDQLQAPPDEWEVPFSVLAKDCLLLITLENAFKETVSFLKENKILME